MHKSDAVPADAAAPLKSLKKKLLRKRIWTIVLTVVGILVVYMLLQFEWFLPCTPENVRVVENYDHSVTVYMEPCSHARSSPYSGNWYDESGNVLEGHVVEITGYTSVWEYLVNKVFYAKLSGVVSITTYPDYEGQPITIFYNQDGRGDYILIHGDDELMENSAYKTAVAESSGLDIVVVPAATATDTN